MPDRWLSAWALGSVALGGASLLVPLYVVSLGGDPFTLGLLAATAAFAGAPGAIIVGRIADRTGRRRGFIVGALAIATVMLGFLPLVESLVVVVAANAAIWFVAAASAPVLALLAVAGIPEDEWGNRYARLNRYQGWGWAGGLVLGSVWTAIGSQFLSPAATQRTFFVACALCSAVAAVLTARWLPDDDEVPIPDRPRRFARVISRSRRFSLRRVAFPFSFGRLYWATRSLDPATFVRRFSPGLAAYYGAAFLFFTGFAAFFAPLPLFLTGQGFGSGAVFGLYLVSSLGSAVFYGRAGALSNRYDLTSLQMVGLVVRAVALPIVAVVGAALAASLAGLLTTGAIFVIIGLAWALIAVTSTTLVTQLAPPSVRGEALGVYTALGALAGGVGSVLGGWLAETSYSLAFLAAATLVLGSAGIVLGLRSRGVRSNAAAAD